MRRVAEGHDALLAPLPGHADQFVFEINVAEVQLGELGNAHARRVHQLEHCAIALAQIGLGIGRFDKANRVLNR